MYFLDFYCIFLRYLLDYLFSQGLCNYDLVFDVGFGKLINYWSFASFLQHNNLFIHFVELFLQFLHVLESLFGFNSKLRLSSFESSIKLHQFNFLVMINYGLRMITFANTSNENSCFIDFVTFIIKLDEWEILLQSLFSPSTVCNQTAFRCVLTEILCEDCMELVIMISIFVLINELWIFRQLLIVNKLYIFGQAVDANDIKTCLQDTCHSWTTSQESISTNDGPIVLLAVSVDITIFHDFVTFTIFF